MSSMFETSADDSVRDMKLGSISDYIPAVIMRIKLLWLLKLQSAISELDHRQCDLTRSVAGIRGLLIRESVLVSAPNGLGMIAGVSASQMNIGSILDDFFSQLELKMGHDFKHFTDFVASCNLQKSIVRTMGDTHLRIISNDEISRSLDDIFLAYIVRLPPTVSVPAVLVSLTRFHLSLPIIGERSPLPAPRMTSALRAASERPATSAGVQFAALPVENSSSGRFPWLRAYCQSSERTSKRLLESHALVEAVHLVVLCETQRVQIQNYVDLLLQIVCRHSTFPTGLRHRIVVALPGACKLSAAQSKQLLSLSLVDVDLPILTRTELYRVDQDEKTRLRMVQGNTHFLQLPPSAGEVGRYWADAPARKHARPPTAEKPFKVSLATGPLVWTPCRRSLQHCRVFHSP